MSVARIVMFILAFLPFTVSVEAGIWDNMKSMIWNNNSKAPPMIDVLIINDQSGVILEVKGKYQIYDPNTKQYISKRYLGKRKYIQSLSSGLKWGEEFPGIFQIQIVPQDLSVTTVVDGIEYRGSLFIYDIGGAISIVNRTPIEDYLSSVLPRQFPNSFSEETLVAISIVARTDAYYRSQNPKNKFWAVDARLVGYKGLDTVDSSAEMDHAIKATRHMVLSKTGTYEKIVTPFAAQWGTAIGGQSYQQQGVFSQISLEEADTMGNDGKHAAQILSKAFPGSHIELIF
ncbi:MAG: SpoIID/LytB domain-containing protein [Waddliaceae bacterium]